VNRRMRAAIGVDAVMPVPPADRGDSNRIPDQRVAKQRGGNRGVTLFPEGIATKVMGEGIGGVDVGSSRQRRRAGSLTRRRQRGHNAAFA